MNNHEMSAQRDAFQRDIYNLCGNNVYPIDPANKLLAPDHNNLLLDEFYSDRFASRVIAAPSDSNVIKNHTLFAENNVPVFSSLYGEAVTLLMVPEGAKRVSSILPLIARDPVSYGFILQDVGKVLRSLKEHGPGLPDLLVLDHLSFSTDNKSPSGGKVHLIPPYVFDPLVQEKELFELIEFELYLVNEIEDNQAHYLLEQLAKGWHANDTQ